MSRSARSKEIAIEIVNKYVFGEPQNESQALLAFVEHEQSVLVVSCVKLPGRAPTPLRSIVSTGQLRISLFIGADLLCRAASPIELVEVFEHNKAFGDAVSSFSFLFLFLFLINCHMQAARQFVNGVQKLSPLDRDHLAARIAHLNDADVADDADAEAPTPPPTTTTTTTVAPPPRQQRFGLAHLASLARRGTVDRSDVAQLALKLLIDVVECLRAIQRRLGVDKVGDVVFQLKSKYDARREGAEAGQPPPPSGDSDDHDGDDDVRRHFALTLLMFLSQFVGADHKEYEKMLKNDGLVCLLGATKQLEAAVERTIAATVDSPVSDDVCVPWFGGQLSSALPLPSVRRVGFSGFHFQNVCPQESAAVGVESTIWHAFKPLRARTSLPSATTQQQRFMSLFKLDMLCEQHCFDVNGDVMPGRTMNDLTMPSYVQLMGGGQNITFFRRRLRSNASELAASFWCVLRFGFPFVLFVTPLHAQRKARPGATIWIGRV